MKRLIDYIAVMLLPVMVMLSSCDDLFEKDISERSIEVIMPKDGYSTSRNQIEFRWDGGKDQRTYRFQIVSPGFSNIEQFVVDSLIAGTQARLVLPAGKYEWRIRGENSTSHSSFYTRTFTIDTNTNFTGQVFKADAPASLAYSNKLIVGFSWTPPMFATRFEYQACDSSKKILRTKFVAASSLIDSFTEGIFYWRMRAFNEVNGTETAYSDFSKLVVDTTPPGAHFQLTPTDGAQVNNNVMLHWQADGDAIKYNLVVAADSGFLTKVFDVENESFSHSLPVLNENTTYYWKLRAVDHCGNWSAFVKPFKFTVIP